MNENGERQTERNTAIKLSPSSDEDGHSSEDRYHFQKRFLVVANLPIPPELSEHFH